MTTASSAPRRSRFLLLWLPRLATDRIARLAWGRSWRSGRSARPADEPPHAVVAREGGSARVTAVDEAARAAGVKVGQGLADARALTPALVVHEADPEADAALLAAIADWADRYTPLVGLQPPDALVLDVTGCAHLFGGEAAMLADALARLEGQGFAVRGAVAGTVGAAFALARHGGGGVHAAGTEREILAGLPLAALRLDAETVAALSRLGLKTIADVAGAPRAPLVARFGPLLARRLDEAFGRLGEAITPRLPPPAAIAERRFAEPVAELETIEAAVEGLTARLAEGLESRGEGARLLELALFRADGLVTRICAGTARPVRDPALLVQLIGERLQARVAGGLDPGFGYDLVRVSILLAARLERAQLDLSGEADRSADVERLIDRLGARLGLDAVTRALPLDSHIPELTAALVPAALAGGAPDSRAPARNRGAAPFQASSTPPAAPGRSFGEPGTQAFDWSAAPRPDAGEPPRFPIRLLGRPEPVETLAAVPDGPPLRFRWRRVLYDVARAEGPERIAPEWWKTDEPGLTRDYFRVEDAEGRRFWMFRDGLFDRETRTPRWYLHGLFA